MLADRGHQGLEFGSLALGQAGNLFLPELLDARIAAGLDPVFVQFDVLSDLLDQRQVFGKRLQPRIGGVVDFLTAAVQAAINAASSLSFLASCEWNLA